MSKKKITHYGEIHYSGPWVTQNNKVTVTKLRETKLYYITESGDRYHKSNGKRTARGWVSMSSSLLDLKTLKPISELDNLNPIEVVVSVDIDLCDEGVFMWSEPIKGRERILYELMSPIEKKRFIDMKASLIRRKHVHIKHYHEEAK